MTQVTTIGLDLAKRVFQVHGVVAAVHRVRERLIAQRTQTINILRGQMAEFGVVAAKGPQHVKGLVAELVEPRACPNRCARFCWGWSDS